MAQAQSVCLYSYSAIPVLEEYRDSYCIYIGYSVRDAYQLGLLADRLCEALVIIESLERVYTFTLGSDPTMYSLLFSP